MGLSAPQFWEMTPHEFGLFAKAWQSKEEHIDRRLAWTQANIMNMWTKDTVRTSDLLPEKKGERAKPILNKQDLIAEMNRRKAIQDAREARA